MFRNRLATIVLVLSMGPGLGRAHFDMHIGRSSQGVLVVRNVPWWHWELPALGPGEPIIGWLDNDPGFSGLPIPLPAEDAYLLQFGANLWLELVAIDPGLRVWSPVLSHAIDTPGQRLWLGPFNLHTHLNWHADAARLGSNFTGLLSLAFRIVDTGATGYAPSAAVVLTFEVVPAIPRDCNNDGHVDVADFTNYLSCLNGPRRPPAGACGCADIDKDGDVDLRDLAGLQRVP